MSHQQDLEERSFPLKDHPLLKRCSEVGLAYLQQVGEKVHWKKGQELVHQGMPTHGIYFILEGKMKVVTQGVFGREHILRLAAEWDVVGHRGINEKEVFPIGIEGLEDGTAFFIELGSFYTFLEQEAKTSFDMMFFFANELTRSEERTERLTQLQVRERVADALLYIRSKFGAGRECFSLPLSRREIGDLAGTTQDQASRCLSEFRREAWIELEQGRIAILDPDPLLELSEGV